MTTKKETAFENRREAALDIHVELTTVPSAQDLYDAVYDYELKLWEILKLNAETGALTAKQAMAAWDIAINLDRIRGTLRTLSKRAKRLEVSIDKRIRRFI